MLVEKVVAPAALLPTARLLTSNTMSSSKLLRRWGSDSADYHMKPRAEPHTARRECTRAPAARPETHKHTAGPVHTSRTTLGHGDTEGVNVGVTDDDGVLDGVTLADGVFVAVPDGDGVNDGVFVAVPDIDGVTDAVAVAVVAAVVDTDGVADGDADAEGDAPTLNDADGVADAAGWAHAACSRVAVTRIHSPRPSRAILVFVAAAARSSGSSHRARSLMQACSFCRRNHLGDWSPSGAEWAPHVHLAQLKKTQRVNSRPWRTATAQDRLCSSGETRQVRVGDAERWHGGATGGRPQTTTCQSRRTCPPLQFAPWDRRRRQPRLTCRGGRGACTPTRGDTELCSVRDSSVTCGADDQ